MGFCLPESMPRRHAWPLLALSLNAFLRFSEAHNYDDHPERYGKMLSSHIIPDVIGAHMEMTRLNVSYRGVDGKLHAADWGNDIRPRNMVSPPAVCTWEVVEYLKDSLQTLVFVGLDLPHRWNASEGEYQQWVVVNIPGNRISAGDVLTAYQGPAPPTPPRGKAPSFGRHRYAYILFKQPGRIDPSAAVSGNDRGDAGVGFIEGSQTDGRKKFSTREFVVKHSLGLPVAVNFLEARHDPKVPEPAAAAAASSSAGAGEGQQSDFGGGVLEEKEENADMQTEKQRQPMTDKPAKATNSKKTQKKKKRKAKQPATAGSKEMGKKKPSNSNKKRKKKPPPPAPKFGSSSDDSLEPSAPPLATDSPPPQP